MLRVFSWFASRMNQQLRPVLDLLRQTENLNLAPELLDPEPHGIGDRIRQIKIRSGMIKPSKEEWTASKTYVMLALVVTLDGGVAVWIVFDLP